VGGGSGSPNDADSVKGPEAVKMPDTRIKQVWFALTLVLTCESSPHESSLHVSWFAAVPGHPEWIDSTVSNTGAVPHRFTVSDESRVGLTEYHTSPAVEVPLHVQLPSLVAPTVVPFTTSGLKTMFSGMALAQLSLGCPRATPLRVHMRAAVEIT
jgi:hypothetical protein